MLNVYLFLFFRVHFFIIFIHDFHVVVEKMIVRTQEMFRNICDALFKNLI